MNLKQCMTSALIAVAASAPLMLSGTAFAAQSASNAENGITSVTMFNVKPEREAAFMTVMRANMLHSRSEDGNMKFDVYRSAKGAAVTFYVVETWANAEAKTKHAAQPTLVALHKAFAADLASPPKSEIAETVMP